MHDGISPRLAARLHGACVVFDHADHAAQETNRNHQSSAVDERTLFEVYYRPFAAAVAAGAAAVMVSRR